MKLYLAVPRQTGQKKTETVTRPAQTREWIARLPLLNTRESLRQIHTALYDINRTELRTTQRLKLLDMYRSPLRVIRGQVETQLAKGAVPLSDNDLLAVEFFRECCVEMAYGYKATILEIAQSRKRRQMDEMRLSMGRAMFYLEQTIFACALYRQATPEGIWQEMHTIYYYARSLGITEDSIKDPITKARSQTSISLTYRRALLFGLSDPFHQSIPLMGRVLEFLRRNAQNADLRDYAQPPTERCQFIIDPQSDYPARAYVKQADQKPPKDALLLDTVALTRRAHDQLKRLTSAEQVDVALDDEFQDDLGRKLLEEVVYAWGLIPRREEERRAVEQKRVEVMTGIAAVNFCLNGETAFELSSTDHADRSATAGTFQLHQVRRRQTRTGKLECRVLDRGESGLRLGLSYDAATVGILRVGDIIACRADDEPWTPALIRWMRCVEDVIQFGVKKLGGGVLPVAVKPVSTEREDPFKEALAVRSGDDEGASLQLLTPPGLYRYQRNLFVDDGETLLMVRGRKLIERSQMVERFECETINL